MAKPAPPSKPAIPPPTVRLDYGSTGMTGVTSILLWGVLAFATMRQVLRG